MSGRRRLLLGFAAVGRRWGEAGGTPVASRSGACPNLLQRPLVTGSAANKSAEYQRSSSRAPARSGPLQQIWTTGAADRSGRVAARRTTTTMGTPTTSTSLNPRARTSGRRARGLSDVLEGYPAISRTAAPTSGHRSTPRCVFRIRECSSNRHSRVQNAHLDGKMHISTRKGPAAPRPVAVRHGPPCV